MRLGQKSCLVFFCLLLFSKILSAQVAVSTYHYDSGRTGANTNEAVLTPGNVSVNSFGKLFSYAFNNAPLVYAQPLYMPNVSIGGQLHNVLYIATELDTVLALDADQQQTLWQADLAANVGGTPVDTSSNGPIPYGGYMGDQIGICGTPVIDPATATL
jgi:hypothetical protein